MKKREETDNPHLAPRDHEIASNALFRKQKRVDDIDLLSPQEESRRRQRMAARNNTLDVMLTVLLVTLVLVAVTRLAVWLANAF